MQTYQTDWEKDLDDKFTEVAGVIHRTVDGHPYAAGRTSKVKDIKSFIRSLLQAREEWLRRGFVEKLEAIQAYAGQCPDSGFRKGIEELCEDFIKHQKRNLTHKN